MPAVGAAHLVAGCGIALGGRIHGPIVLPGNPLSVRSAVYSSAAESVAEKVIESVIEQPEASSLPGVSPRGRLTGINLYDLV